MSYPALMAERLHATVGKIRLVLLLFGGKKIPELMKGLGKGIRSFKEGMNNIEKEIENPDQEKK